MKLMGNNREKKKGISKKNIIYCEQSRAAEQIASESDREEERSLKKGEQRHEHANSGPAVIWRCLRD